MYSHARLNAPPTQWQPVIKGIPELQPILSDSAVNRSVFVFAPPLFEINPHKLSQAFIHGTNKFSRSDQRA